jgi:hypothetical protein
MARKDRYDALNTQAEHHGHHSRPKRPGPLPIAATPPARDTKGRLQGFPIGAAHVMYQVYPLSG